MVGVRENKPSCVPLLFNSGFKLFWRSRGRVKKKEVWPPKAFLKPSIYVWVRDWETYLVFFKTKIKTPISPPKLLQQYICKKNMLKLMYTLLHSESKNILGIIIIIFTITKYSRVLVVSVLHFWPQVGLYF